MTGTIRDDDERVPAPPRAVLPRCAISIATGVVAWFLTSDPASAHIVTGPMGGFASGFEHPLSGPDHLLAMFAVGLWGAQMGGRQVWMLPVTFPLIMCVGGVLGIAGVAMPGIELGIACSIIVLGAAILAEWKAPEWLALLIVAFFAVFHGYAHGAELPMAADPAAYAVGFVVATGMIHVVGIAVGLLFGRLYEGRVSRALGGLIVLAGLYYLVNAVA
ncbi:HupE/UreJ family protein [Pararhizobium mangrovi]|uniref:HupE/UreJ family protein n=1 Tax=Pararhizobium mangrovi TaxID=2590452 RepID=A0A506UB65_9HYPH|nr:HupE/UreJ family protein [Pararhizobium mangrovi]TPW30361.1 HupE/UreJ family protein [Pararhizobium mangrovi]